MQALAALVESGRCPDDRCRRYGLCASGAASASTDRWAGSNNRRARGQAHDGSSRGRDNRARRDHRPKTGGACRVGWR
jgi:hypothetical protein